ncbi:hypothetical protein M5689_017966 [Euphorbia peplus]|nr:hypothetical protein M5689_017966 [Euphorbia peplus]
MNMEQPQTKLVKSELDFTVDFTKSIRDDEFEETSEKVEARVIELEKEIEMRKKEYEELEAKFRELEARNKSLEAELKAFRIGNNESTRRDNSLEDVDSTGEGDREDEIFQLMAENRVLECEKREAESQVVFWKDKFKELELRVSKMDVRTTPVKDEKPRFDDIVKGENRPDIKSNVEQAGSVPRMSLEDLPASGTPYKDSPCIHTPLAGREGICSDFEVKHRREVRKHLSFEEERSPRKKIAPSTPGTTIPTNFNVIDIFDSKDESDIHVSTEHVLAETLDGKKDEICLQDYEEDVDDYRDKVPSTLTSKRKRVAKIVTSDIESDEDDNLPISKIIKISNQEKISKVESSDAIGNAQFSASRPRRRLLTLRKCEEKVTKQDQARPTSDDDDGESEEVGSESEGDSLDRFIVNTSDSSSAHRDIPIHSENESDASSAQDVPSHSESESDGFEEILCKLERSKDRKKCKWEFEADMLSAFGKDLELCMKAVCALYRQQTSDEQVSKEAKYGNGRGFSKFDAFRGTELAEFLTDGDPEGDLKKSKKQLEEYGSSAVELCRTLATRYSKQLFEIYKNKEDALFLPS